jgi:hypothetical protein
MTQTPSKASSLNTITLGIRLPHMNSGGTDIQTTAQGKTCEVKEGSNQLCFGGLRFLLSHLGLVLKNPHRKRKGASMAAGAA